MKHNPLTQQITIHSGDVAALKKGRDAYLHYYGLNQPVRVGQIIKFGDMRLVVKKVELTVEPKTNHWRIVAAQECAA